YVLKKIGFDGFKAEYDKEREGIRAQGREKNAIHAVRPVPTPPPTGPADLAALDDPAYRRWFTSNTMEQVQPGYRVATVRAIRGDITSSQFRALARLCRDYGDGTVRLTIEQNLVMRFVPTSKVAGL